VLGTTSVDVEDPDEFSTDDAEIGRTFEECSAMLAGLDRDRIDRVYWGVRPLYTEDRERYEGRQISRGFYLLDHNARDGIDGLTTIVGGKLTTYRRMAEAVGDRVADRLGVEEPSRTAETPLVGHDDPGRIDALVRGVRGAEPRGRGRGDLGVNGPKAGR
jgi:glycerol-3-phosphate dehydrogenase